MTLDEATSAREWIRLARQIWPDERLVLPERFVTRRPAPPLELWAERIRIAAQLRKGGEAMSNVNELTEALVGVSERLRKGEPLDDSDGAVLDLVVMLLRVSVQLTAIGHVQLRNEGGEE